MSRAAAAAAGLAALTAGAARGVLTARPPGGRSRWERTNHRGETLTLLEGPAWTAGALAGVLAAPGLPPGVRAGAATGLAAAGVLGAVDDLAERGSSKGLRGHLGELAHGRLTTGGLKVVGIGTAGVLAAWSVLSAGPGRPAGAAGVADVVVAGGVVAAAANLVNLLDLRPGRALKVVLAGAVPALAAGGPAATLGAAAAGTSAVLLPDDLAERSMLGDAGANAAGALLGAALVAGTAGAPGGRAVRAGALGVLAGLTLASERVSFTRVIERTPVLRELDALGRRPPAPPAPGAA